MTVSPSVRAGGLRLVNVELRPLVQPGPGAERHTLAIAPRGGLFEIKAAPENVAAVLARCDGTRTAEEVTEGTSDPAGYREVLDKLTELGALSSGTPSTARDAGCASPMAPGPSPTGWPPPR